MPTSPYPTDNPMDGCGSCPRITTNGFANRLGDGFALSMKRYTNGDNALWMLEANEHPTFSGSAPLRMVATKEALLNLADFARRAQEALCTDGGRAAEEGR